MAFFASIYPSRGGFTTPPFIFYGMEIFFAFDSGPFFDFWAYLSI
jgi:hypothetical protein